MSAADRQRAAERRTARRRGTILAFRRQAGLHGEDGGVLIDLEFAEAAVAGDLEVALSAVGGGAVRGHLPAGMRIVVGVVAYVSAERSQVVRGRLVVPLTEPTAAEHEAGDAVEVEPVRVLQYLGRTRAARVEEVDGDRITLADRIARLVAGSATSVLAVASPEIGDVGPGGLPVQSIQTVGEIDDPVAWVVAMGRRP